jgi:hypothetical protein
VAFEDPEAIRAAILAKVSLEQYQIDWGLTSILSTHQPRF